MFALSRLVEKWLDQLLDQKAKGEIVLCFLRYLMAAALIGTAVWIAYLRINYNLSLGPR